MNRIKQANLLQSVSESSNDYIIQIDYSLDTPLKSIIDTPLTDSLVNEIFHEQNNVNYSRLFLINKYFCLSRMVLFQQQTNLVNYSMLIMMK